MRVPVEGQFSKTQEWGSKKIPYLFWPDWEDHTGVSPEELGKLADLVRKQTKEQEIIAVHCSAGVGRTGTFIAAICLLDAIDAQLEKGIVPDQVEISLAELFLYLNFHRPWLVAKPAQYLTLYQMVGWYLAQQKQR